MNWEDIALEALDRLTKLVQTTAPELWRIARTQVYAEVAARGVGVLVAAAISIILFYFANYLRKQSKDAHPIDREGYEAGRWILTVIGIVAGLSAMMLVSDIAKMLINPDYYAIQIIIDLVVK